MRIPIFEIEANFEGIFIRRINKFLGIILIDGVEVFAHIHDPGRLEGLLENGNRVLLKKFDNPKRKTQFEVVSVKLQNETVLVNSRYHNNIAESIIKNGLAKFETNKIKNIKREFSFLSSRFDFLVESNFRHLIEVKGCVLVKDGVALFPDAPTKRGARHMLELVKSIEYGFKPQVFVLIFREAKEFKPNGEIDKDFEKNYYYAISKGVEVKKILLSYDGKWVYFEKFIP